MYRIGLFSKMNRVTVKTLRFYDDEGLLKPCKVDEWTGYRYYSGEAITKLHHILALKQIGLSIKEIKTILEKNLTNEELINLLISKKTEMAKTLESEKSKLSRIESIINDLKTENKMENNVILKDLPEVIVASMRQIIASYDEFGTVYPKMCQIMKKQGAKCAVPQYGFTRYHSSEHREKDIDIEICESVDKMYEGGAGVEYKKLPPAHVASILHKGPYETLGRSYKEVYERVEKNGYKASDLSREVYIDGCWNKENPEDWLTEIQVPIE
jgi:DNA-binding transcriptional MerR regulator